MLRLLQMGLAVALFGTTAHATEAPVIVIPGKPGVPVIINGYDASYAVVEGDWGLDRPGAMPATIVSGPLIVAEPQHYYPGYFPAFGRTPGYGRREIEPPPNRKLPPPAPTYERFWGSESMQLPATIDEPHTQINVDASAGVDRPRRRYSQGQSSRGRNTGHSKRTGSH